MSMCAMTLDTKGQGLRLGRSALAGYHVQMLTFTAHFCPVFLSTAR